MAATPLKLPEGTAQLLDQLGDQPNLVGFVQSACCFVTGGRLRSVQRTRGARSAACARANTQVPDELTAHLMRKAGQDCKDERL